VGSDGWAGLIGFETCLEAIGFPVTRHPSQGHACAGFRLRGRVALAEGLEEEDRTGDGGVERPDRASHRDPDEQVAAPPNGRAETVALASDDDRDRPPKVCLSSRQRRVGIRSENPEAANMEVREGAGQVVHRSQQEVLGGAGRGLDRGRAEGRLPLGRKDHPVGSRGLGASEQRADVLGILERIEHENERRLAALDGPGEDVVEAREPPRRDDEGDPLVAVEPSQRCQGAALDLDDRDAKGRGVQDDPLERLPALGDDKQPQRRTLGSEGLLDRPAPSDELFVRSERRQRRGGRTTRVIAAAKSFSSERRAREPGAARSAGAGPASTRLIGSGSIGRPTARVARARREAGIGALGCLGSVVRFVAPAAPGRRCIGPRRLAARNGPTGAEWRTSATAGWPTRAALPRRTGATSARAFAAIKSRVMVPAPGSGTGSGTVVTGPVPEAEATVSIRGSLAGCAAASFSRAAP